MPNALSVIFTPRATECHKTIAKQLSGIAWPLKRAMTRLKRNSG